MVDNVNDPAPEKIPNQSEDLGDIFEDWGHDRICPCQQVEGEYKRVKLKNSCSV